MGQSTRGEARKGPGKSGSGHFAVDEASFGDDFGDEGGDGAVFGVCLVCGEVLARGEFRNEHDVGAGGGCGEVEADFKEEEAGDLAAEGFEFFADQAGVGGLVVAEGAVFEFPHDDVADHGGRPQKEKSAPSWTERPPRSTSSPRGKSSERPPGKPSRELGSRLASRTEYLASAKREAFWERA